MQMNVALWNHWLLMEFKFHSCLQDWGNLTSCVLLQFNETLWCDAAHNTWHDVLVLNESLHLIIYLASIPHTSFSLWNEMILMLKWNMLIDNYIMLYHRLTFNNGSVYVSPLSSHRLMMWTEQSNFLSVFIHISCFSYFDQRSSS